MGLGALTKGPVALIVPAAVSLLYCASRGEWLRWARMVFNPLGWLLLVAIVAPWYIHAYARHGQDFIDGFILRHNVQRFSGSLEGHGGSAFYYVLAVPLLLLPWSGLFFMALGRLRGLQGPAAAFPVAVVRLRAGLLLAVRHQAAPLRAVRLHPAVRAGRAAGPVGAPGLAAPAGADAAVRAVPAAAQHLRCPRPQHPGRRLLPAQLGRALEVADTRYIALTVGGLVVWGFVLFPRVPLLAKLTVTAALQAGLLAAVVVPYAGELAQGPVKAAGLKARELGESVVFWRFTTAPSFSVYRQAVTLKGDPQPGQLALTRADRLPADAKVDTVFRQGGVVLVRIKP
jgi:hypothetical protein